MNAPSRALLADRLWTASLPRNVVLAVLGSLLLAISAKVQVPMWPVPMTMQSFVVTVIGMAFGARLAGATVGLYLLQGAVGLPVFASGAGLLYMAGPTGGYLAGFLAAAIVCGTLAERGWDRSVAGTLAAMTIGTVIIMLPGYLWLGHVIGWDKDVFALGVGPFIAGSVVKILLGAATLPLAWRLLRQR
jgi:biotin transport system substrate-specific component